jgi:hypothetical protein
MLIMKKVLTKKTYGAIMNKIFDSKKILIFGIWGGGKFGWRETSTTP